MLIARRAFRPVGDAHDNVMCESFFATLETELIERKSFRNQAEARMAVFDFIEAWYNLHRRHSALGQLPPLNYEREHALQLESLVHCRAPRGANSRVAFRFAESEAGSV